MKIAIGSDHRGFVHKQELLRALAMDGHTVTDCGCRGPDAADYPDAALVVASNVADGGADTGILICGSGIGMSITANKVASVRRRSAATSKPLGRLAATTTVTFCA